METNKPVSNLRFSAARLAGMALCCLIVLFFASASALALTIGPDVEQQIGAAAGDVQSTVILSFAEQPSAEVVGSVASRIKITHRFQQLPMLVVQGYPSQIKSLLDLPGLISVEADRQLRYYTREGVPVAGGSRQRDVFGFKGNGIGVAILDSGIDGTHPDIHYPERTIQNVKIVCIDPSCLSYTYVEDIQNTDTSSGHGTHVAGIAAGDGSARPDRSWSGMAPGASLVGISAGDAIFITEALAGFDYILKNRDRYNIRVVNCSWGTTGDFNEADAVNQATRILHDSNITVVFAAGNDGPGDNTLNPYSVAPWVIGVGGAVKDGRALADFSSRGRPNDSLYHPTISAPGVAITSAKSATPVVTATDLENARSQDYATLSGTSMATPFVSGAIADMLQGAPWLTPDNVKTILVNSAVPMPGYGLYQAGAGFLAVDRAVATATGRLIPLNSNFKVAAASPASGTKDVPRDTQITLAFSQALDPASVNSGNIFLLDRSSGYAIPVTVSTVGSTQVKVTPAKQLASNREYSIVVAEGIRNASGSYPIASFVSTFTTASCPVVCLNLPISLTSR